MKRNDNVLFLTRRGRRVYNGRTQERTVELHGADAELALELQRGFKPVKDKIYDAFRHANH